MKPELSVIIPVRSELPGETVTRLSQACQEFASIEVIVVQGHAVSRQRNEAVQIAKSPFLYFIDDDSCVDIDALKEGIKLIHREDVDVVGGPSITRADAGFWELCFGEVVAVPFGAWHLLARVKPVGSTRKVDGEELISCNLMIRKEVYQQLAGMDENLYPGEDTDFIRRLRLSGANLYYNPDMIVRRPRRQHIHEFIAQYYQYGVGRGKRAFTTFSLREFVYWMPTLFLLYVLSLLFMPGQFSIVPFFAYLMLSFVSGLLIAARTGSFPVGMASASLFLPLHLCYGTGVAAGLVMNLFGNLNRNMSVLNVTIIEYAYGEEHSKATSTALI